MKRLFLFLLLIGIFIALTGCGSDEMLDPSNPTTITVWNHYTGPALNAFDAAVHQFNETVGRNRGIIVVSSSFGNMGDIERTIRSIALEETGSGELPNIFVSFPDTAYVAKSMGLLVDLDDYISPQEIAEYFPPFIERGRIGLDGELHIFPVASSPEVLIVNYTDWAPFARANNLTEEDLISKEGIARVAGIYYGWSGGRSFFGRDAKANIFVIGHKQFGVELFDVDRYGQVEVNVDERVMRLIWDYYYVPFIRGYFAAYGRFRSEDLRVGDILMYVGSTGASAFFPEYVREDGENRPIESLVLPVPTFRDGERVLVKQGAGMVVTKATPEEQYASAIFLRWFTETEQNVGFSALSGHTPVKIASMDYDLVREVSQEQGINLTVVTEEALRVSLDDMKNSEMYASPSFPGGVPARAVLYNHLREKAIADRQGVLDLIASGMLREDAIATFNTDSNFRAWLTDFTNTLTEAAS